MSKLLVIAEKELDLSFLTVDYTYLNMREPKDVVNLMDVYETIEPERCDIMRKEIETIAPDKIVVIGELEGYKWLATIVSRLFGRFNSWLGQYDADHGETEIVINGKTVPLFAFKSVEDWREFDAL